MKTDIVYILDRSGSMSYVWGDAFAGLNHFIEEQKKIEDECTFSLILFDHSYETPIDCIDMQKVSQVSHELAYPRGSTALYDAIGKSIVLAKDRGSNNKSDKVIFVIMTDGHENSSEKYTKPQIKEMIQQQESEHGWEFIFMGAGVDAMAEGAKLGMKMQNTANFAKSKAGLTRSSVYSSDTVMGYRTENK